MRHLKSLFTVIGAVTVLVLAANTVAMATTGHSFLLGKSNSANKATSLSRTTSGTVLNLHSKASSNAPLSVNGRGKVANFNADLLDGLDSSALQNRTYVYTISVPASPPKAGIFSTLPLPTGKYILTYSAVFSGIANKVVRCYFSRTPAVGPPSYFGDTEFDAGADVPAVSGAGFVDKTAGTTVALACGAGGDFTTLSNDPIQVTATRVDTVTTGTLAP